jgi:diaminopimelate epimerase
MLLLAFIPPNKLTKWQYCRYSMTYRPQMDMKFSKYEAAGNDIIIFDFLPGDLRMVSSRLERFLRRIAHRSFGVGADEIAFVRPAKLGHAVAVVTFYNSDGSRAETCGNGLRCVAKHLYELKKTGGRRSFDLGTDAGWRKCSVITSRSGEVFRVRIDMGRVRSLDGSGERLGEAGLKIGGKTFRAVTASMGNPHAVFFGKFGTEDMRRIGEKLQKHGAFPGGVNAGFASVSGRRSIDLVVWERGCGFTLACGSGACAAAAAAVTKGLCDPDGPIEVRMPGGTLQITVRKKDLNIFMAGPVRRVFTGTLQVETRR